MVHFSAFGFKFKITDTNTTPHSFIHHSFRHLMILFHILQLFLMLDAFVCNVRICLWFVRLYRNQKLLHFIFLSHFAIYNNKHIIVLIYYESFFVFFLSPLEIESMKRIFCTALNSWCASLLTVNGTSKRLNKNEKIQQQKEQR